MGQTLLRWMLLGVLACVAVDLRPVAAYAQQENPFGEEAPTEEVVEAEAEAETEPAPSPRSKDKWDDQHSIFRLGSPSISWLKFVPLALLFLLWVWTGDWVNRDSQIYAIGYGTWNPVIFFPFAVCMLLIVFPILFAVPFLISSILLTLVYLVCTFTYVGVRNKRVERHERVLTAEWFRYEIARVANLVGIKMEAERKAEYEKGAAVDLMAMGATEERDNQANLITARQSPGYLLVKEMVADMVDRHADRALLDYSSQSVAVQHRIDGVWHNGDARDRESGDVMLAVMKQLANLNITERRKKQAGKFGAKYKQHNYLCPIESQGVKTGERVSFAVLGGEQREFKTYEDLGMREKLRQQWAELMERDTGLIVISAMPEGGLTTLTDVSLMETDRLMRDFFAIEDEHHREREIENIEVVTYDSKKGESPDTILPKLIRRYPNVYVIRDLVNVETAKLLFNEIKDDRLVITTVPAREASEALLRILQKEVPHKDFSTLVTASMNTRLIRKLCEGCKVGYAPAPDMLQKMGIPAGKVEMLYRVPKPEEIEKPCLQCRGVGYKGRTGIFELLIVDDQVREVLLKQPKLDLVRKAARLAGMRTLQEEGILLVAKGVTSVQELSRVLKQ